MQFVDALIRIYISVSYCVSVFFSLGLKDQILFVFNWFFHNILLEGSLFPQEEIPSLLAF